MHFARCQFREGRRLAKKSYFELSAKNQELVDKYNDGTLGRETDEANRNYGYGIAHTNDFGYALGQNMRSYMPSDMLALLRCRVEQITELE